MKSHELSNLIPQDFPDNIPEAVDALIKEMKEPAQLDNEGMEINKSLRKDADQTIQRSESLGSSEYEPFSVTQQEATQNPSEERAKMYESKNKERADGLMKIKEKLGL